MTERGLLYLLAALAAIVAVAIGMTIPVLVMPPVHIPPVVITPRP